jgi:hypothetical protein
VESSGFKDTRKSLVTSSFIIIVFHITGAEVGEVKEGIINISLLGAGIKMSGRKSLRNGVSRAAPSDDMQSPPSRVFQRRVKSMGIEEVKTAYRSSWQNAYVERLNGSIR